MTLCSHCSNYLTKFVISHNNIVLLLVMESINFWVVNPADVLVDSLHGAQTDVVIGRFSMKTRRYVGKREENITAEFEKLLSLLCFVNAFPKTNHRRYPQYTSE